MIILILFLSLLIISVLVSVYALRTAMTEEEYIADALTQQKTVTYGRFHPRASDPRGNQEMFRAGNLPTLAFG